MWFPMAQVSVAMAVRHKVSICAEVVSGRRARERMAIGKGNLMNGLLIRCALIAVVTASLCSRGAQAAEESISAEQAVRLVLTQVANTAESANCDQIFINAGIADITATIQRRDYLEAFDKVDRHAALLATCGPQRGWKLSSTAESVATQLVAAVQLQSKLPEQQRNLYVIRRNEQWAAVLIRYARQYPASRGEAEEDSRILEQSLMQMS